MPLSADLTIAEVVAATKCKLLSVQTGWPLILAELNRKRVGSRNSQIGLAANIAHETAYRFEPIQELHASRTKQPKLWALQERYWPSGYYGRGYIQLTWDENYEKCGKAIGVDLLANPELLLQPATSAKAAVWFWHANKCHELCDKGQWEVMRKRVNGGTLGMEEVLKIIRRFGVVI